MRRPDSLAGLTTRVGVVVMTVLLGLYLVFAVYYGTVLLRVGETVAVLMGLALLVLPLLGGIFLVAELVFGRRAARLARRLEEDGALPEEELPVLPSGRVDRKAADAAFPAYQRAVEDAPEDWRAWFRLALAYDACGDRRRARWATRQAIGFERRPDAGDDGVRPASPQG